MKTEIINLSQIQVNGANPRTIKDDKFAKLVNSILVFPQMLELRPIVVTDTHVALGGNMRYRALTFISDMSIADLKARLVDIRDYQKKTPTEQDNLIAYWERWQDNPTAPIIKAGELSDEQQKEFVIKDNVGYGEWDYDMLANDWDSEDLDDWGLDVWQDNDDDSGDGSSENSKPTNSSLADRFVVPPFSILDTRKGYWQARKKMWRELIGDMGESRQGTLITASQMKYSNLYTKTREHRESLGLSFKEYVDKYVSEEEKEREASKVYSTGVSLFDPVLSELMCRWFMPEKGGKIFDCFAGDTQKGLVFGQCGYEFAGIELRQEQVDINNKVIADRGLPVRYICDDGQNVANHFEPNSQDMLFSCPPYYDLEKYSDLDNDASNQGTYEEFLVILQNAFKAALGCLKENRFAVIVVGDVRDKKTGFYHNFVDDMKRIFAENGCPLYNEFILVGQIGSIALQATRYMESRKVAKTHQNVLVFYKGNPKDISKIFGKIEFTEEDLQLFYAAAKVEEINE
jgi:hypothetical protein